MGKVVAVANQKGGVGKTTVAVNLAISLARSGARVGLLDADILGPNVPMMMGVEQMPPVRNRKMVPAENYGVKFISMAFLVKPDQPLIWRGPMLHSAIRQLFTDVAWEDVDYMIVDLPPGTGDAQLSLSQTIPLTGAVMVTTPQEISLIDVRKGADMFGKVSVPILGVIENMSYHSLDLFYKGEITLEELLEGDDGSSAGAAILYGAANWHYCDGQTATADEMLRGILELPGWAAFGYIAAEADLASRQ